MLSTCENMKLFHEKMKESVVAVMMPGPDSGRITAQKAYCRVAPSTIADSSSSRGIELK